MGHGEAKMTRDSFIKWRDEYLQTRWDREEPFGYDHPDTIEFIKDMMTASMDYQYRKQQARIKELEAKLQIAREALKKLSVSGLRMDDNIENYIKRVRVVSSEALKELDD